MSAPTVLPTPRPPGPPGYRPRTRRERATGALVRGTALGLVVAALAGATWFADWRRHRDPQRSVAAAVLPAADEALYRGSAEAALLPGAWSPPIVLAYHDITEQPSDSPYVVTPEAFEEQAAMLEAAGYRSLTAAEFLAYRAGRHTPPARSVLITFDDGTAGLWRYADDVLRRHGFTAVAFVITGRVGTHRPYYLTWSQVEALHANGRWDIESHTRDLHDRVLTGPDGALGGDLSHRLYTDDGYETREAFRARVQADLYGSVEDLVAHGLPTPTLFAYPFSDAVEADADPEDIAVPRTVLDRLFDVSFVNVGTATMPASRRSASSTLLERLEVTRHTTTRALFDELSAMTALPVGALDLATDGAAGAAADAWLEPSRIVPPLVRAGDGLTVDAATETYVAADFAPQRTADWSGYRLEATIDGLVPGVTGALRVRVGSDAELSVRVSAAAVEVVGAGGTVVARAAGAGAASARVGIDVAAARTRVTVDGVTIVTVSVPTGPVPTGPVPTGPVPTATGSGTATATGGPGLTAGRSTTDLAFPRFTGLRVSPLRAAATGSADLVPDLAGRPTRPRAGSAPS